MPLYIYKASLISVETSSKQQLCTQSVSIASPKGPIACRGDDASFSTQRASQATEGRQWHNIGIKFQVAQVVQTLRFELLMALNMTLMTPSSF
jgi:hypothetical protein